MLLKNSWTLLVHFPYIDIVFSCWLVLVARWACELIQSKRCSCICCEVAIWCVAIALYHQRAWGCVECEGVRVWGCVVRMWGVWGCGVWGCKVECVESENVRMWSYVASVKVCGEVTKWEFSLRYGRFSMYHSLEYIIIMSCTVVVLMSCTSYCNVPGEQHKGLCHFNTEGK